MNISKSENSFQQILTKLCNFWGDFGCVLIPPAQIEFSSPLFHPISFFDMIKNKNIDLMYFQPHIASKNFQNIDFSIQNYSFLKFQVLIKSDVKFPQKIFLDSLIYLGISLKDNDIEFENNSFNNEIFRIISKGYHVFFNSISMAEINYIQNAGHDNLENIPLSIVYDLGKIMAILQNENDMWNISWNGFNGKDKISYHDIMYSLEKSSYDFIKDDSTNEIIFKGFDNFKNTASILLENNIIISAYIFILKAKYCLDILNYRNYISYNNKVVYTRQLRDLVDICCKKYNGK